jgi:choice-of-anchor A domain-containing protein
MRLRSLLVASVVVPITASSSLTMASQPHPWCVPGSRLIPNDSGTDAQTLALIDYVCDQVPSCCIYQSRWTVACVERGEAYYAANIGSDDVCGRRGWIQGPIAGTDQFYPRDFNLVTLGDPQNPSYAGDASGMQDIQGPVAVHGTLTTTSFAMNSISRRPVAVVTNGALNLSNGTVYGNAFWGSTTNGLPGVNFQPENAIRIKQPGVIDFRDAAGKLQAMSTALKRYTANATPVPNSNGTINMVGTDPELNAFRVSSGSLTGAYNFVINVPQGSAVIINITGSNPAIYGAGFTRLNGLSPSSMLWNFPDATSLKIQSVGFVGSILAPFAEADLRWGSIGGTVVVKKSIPTWIELHWAPFRFPVGGGCLVRDPSWSCSDDTKIDDSGRAVTLAPEVGFLQIDGGDYISESQSRKSPTHRLWYSFIPSTATSPASKPVAVLFNGGPGAATSAGLFALNTGPWTLDPNMVGGGTVAANPSSWAQYFNLLYIDGPGAGFSYILPAPDGSKPSVGYDMGRDAAVVGRAIVRFLDRHPIVQGNQVLIVGESYGGDRSTLMLDQLLNYSVIKQEPGNSNPYQDTPYYNDMLSHFIALWGPNAILTPEKIAGQFGHQVLIQPNVLGYYQFVPGFTRDMSVCAYPSTDSFNCGHPSTWYSTQLTRAGENLTHIKDGTLQKALGADLRSVAWITPGQRAQAYGRAHDLWPISADRKNELISVFGGLISNEDSFLVVLNTDVNEPPVSKHYYEDTMVGPKFVKNLKVVKTFITHSYLDQVVPTAEIAVGLDYFKTSLGVTRVTSSSGWITVEDPVARSIRFPDYPNAGHSASMADSSGVLGAPSLLADVWQWY